MTTLRARVLSGIALSVAVLLSTTACAQPAPEPTPTATAKPVVTPTPTPTPTPAGPTALFDGDCGAMLSEDALSQLLGEPMHNVHDHWKADDVGRLGGISCSWSKTGTYREVVAWIKAMPEESLNSGGDGLQCEDQQDCVFETVNGIRVQAFVGGYGAQVDSESLSELLSLVVKRVEAQPVPVVDRVREGWWTLSDCESILARVSPDFGLELQPRNPNLPGGGSLTTGTELYCDFSRTNETGYSHHYGARFSAGGAPDIDSALASEGSYEVTVEGAVRAAFAHSTVTFDAAPPLVVATDGVNLLDVSVPFPENDIESASAVASALLRALAD